MRHLLFGIHCHQPLDNFHNVVDTAIEKSYLPFLKAVVNYPDFRFAVHYSGWLLEYIKNYSRETFELLQTVAENGQAEFFSGGFYEPILASIPSPYRRMQINKLNGFIKDNFGQTPKGLWLTERVWDAAIIPDLVECGIEYVIVDDYHFISAGFDKSSLYGYYTSEQDGYKIKIFPIDQTLRYTVPYKEPEIIEEYLLTLPDEKNHAGILFDDGEKFGLWPESYEWVYEKGWLDRFMKWLGGQNKIACTHFGEFAGLEKPLGLAYLPAVSYPEMGEWALFADKFAAMEHLKATLIESGLKDEAETFVKGSIWKNFLAKYPESNRMHKRSLALAKKALELNDEALYDIVCKTQVNDALWHGIFGGLYLPNLRNNLYHYIIEANMRLDKLTGPAYPIAEDAFYSFDGYGKVSLRTASVNAMFDQRDNGQMVALENRPGCFNYQNTLARHFEGYHAQMLHPKEAKPEHEEQAIATIHDAVLEVDEHVKQYIKFDWYNRNSFVDHIVKSFDLKEFAGCEFKELSNFTNLPADHFEKENAEESASVVFLRKGGLFDGNVHQICYLRKKYVLDDKNELGFVINLTTGLNAVYTYVLEFNFHFNDFKAITVNDQSIAESSCFSNYAFIISDDNTKPLKLTFDREVTLYTTVINTVSQSEEGVDLTTQGLAVFVPFEFADELEISGQLQILG